MKLTVATGTPSGWHSWKRRPRFEVVYVMPGERIAHSALAWTVEDAIAEAEGAERYVVYGLRSGLKVAAG